MLKSTGLVSMHFFSKTVKLPNNYLQNGYLQQTANHTKAPKFSEVSSDSTAPVKCTQVSAPCCWAAPATGCSCLHVPAVPDPCDWLRQPGEGQVSGTTPTRADPEQAGEGTKLCWGLGVCREPWLPISLNKIASAFTTGIQRVNRSGQEVHA